MKPVRDMSCGGQLGHAEAAFAKGFEHGAPGGVGERGEDRVEGIGAGFGLGC